MTTDDINSGEKRMLEAKIKHNLKQLYKGEEDNDQVKINRCKSNIEQYEKELAKLENSKI